MDFSLRWPRAAKATGFKDAFAVQGYVNKVAIANELQKRDNKLDSRWSAHALQVRKDLPCGKNSTFLNHIFEVP